MVQAETVVDRLIEIGSLKYAPESEHDRLREQLVETVASFLEPVQPVLDFDCTVLIAVVVTLVFQEIQCNLLFQ